MCTRQDFFGAVLEETTVDGTVVRDPDSLAERIRNHPAVTNFVPVEGAAVPILTFDWDSINIDLLFARLNSASVPSNFDIDHDAVLDGVDSATEKSLNGPRVTNLIAALVSGTPARYQTFLTVVRCVRKWAKARGLYSNKMGYWGGVNINIAVALCVQLYPNDPPASLLRKFFLVFKTWRWPNPVMLTKPHDAGYGLSVWNAQHVQNARQVAPIITPAYPAMNSTLAVSRQTLQIMHEEFCRGHDIVDRLWKQYQANPNAANTATDLNWGELFEPSDFFIMYPHYLSLCIVGPTQSDAQAWIGFVESRLRKLVSDLLGRSLPLSKIQLWPKKIEACVADRSALLTPAQRRNCITYFVGFQVDVLRMRGRALNVELQLHNFREWELSRFQPLLPGMDILVKAFTVKELPRLCFEGIYEGGKVEAMKRRRQLREGDPKLKERKHTARLQKLRDQMAQLERKRAEQKEQEDEDDEAAAEAAEHAKQELEQAQDEGQPKRPREEGDDAGDDDGENNLGDEPPAKIVKREREDGDDGKTQEELNQEAILLESALDIFQEDTGEQQRKTREEAEADRRKLLAGELLVEGGGGIESDDDEDDAADYLGDGARVMSSAKKVKKSQLKANEPPPPPQQYESKYSLPLGQEEANLLRQAGYNLVSDDEVNVLGANLPTTTSATWRRRLESTLPPATPLVIKFRTKFDIAELDASGHVIDKGDDDFTPSKRWIGRKAGFEFKLGERGLGYYRTGKKVVVPSNTSYY
jgi:poly(A) polymerase